MLNVMANPETCDWCTKEYTLKKRLWGSGTDGIFARACKDHQHLLDKVEERPLKKVTAKSRHRTRDRI
jgi:hypothetical protein